MGLTAERGRTVRNLAIVLLKISVGGLLTWLVLQKVDFSRAFSLIGSFSPLLAMAVLCLFLVQAFLSAWRWSSVSAAFLNASLPLSPAFKFFMLSQFYNQALPSFIPGDASRIWGAAPYSDLRRATLAVVLDRVITLVALLLLSGMGLLLLSAAHRQIPAPVRLALGGLLLAGLAATALVLLFRKRILAGLPAPVRDAFLNAGRSLQDAGRRTALAGWLGLSVIIHGTNIAIVYCIAAAMHLPLSVMAALTTVPLVMAAALLPVTVNGWGVREGAMILLLGQFGLGPTEAATLSVLYGLFQLLFGLAGGLFVLIPTTAPGPGKAVDEGQASIE